MQVIQHYPDAITIFIRSASLDELERRLRGRGTEDEEKIQRRLTTARAELQFVSRYQHVIVNNTVEQAAQEICEILNQSGA